MADHSLQKAGRIKRTADFKRAFQEGRLHRGEFFAVSAYRSANSRNRLGIRVASRYVKTAPSRNRIKRLLREAYRAQQKHLVDEKYDIAIRALKGAHGKLAYAQVAEELGRLFRKAGLLS